MYAIYQYSHHLCHFEHLIDKHLYHHLFRLLIRRFLPEFHPVLQLKFSKLFVVFIDNKKREKILLH